jgi:hypothetical protein
MNYRLLLSEMLIDYSERMSLEENADKRKVYREVIKDLTLALDIEPSQIAVMQEVSNLIKTEI